MRYSDYRMKIKITKISAAETWGIRHEVMWPHKPLNYVKLPHDDLGQHFGLWKMNILISVVSLFFDQDKVQFRKFATLHNEQRNGYGSQLLNYVFNYAYSTKVKKIWCNVRVDKVFFYKKFEMSETEHRFSKGGVDYVIMEKKLF